MTGVAAGRRKDHRLGARRRLTATLFVVLMVGLGGCSRAVPATSSATSTTGTSTTGTSTTGTSTTGSTSSLAPTSLAASSTSSSTSSSTTATSAVVPICTRSSLRIKAGRSSGALGTIALGFVVTNTGSSTCAIDGFPAIVLVPAAGTVHPEISHTGSAQLVSLAGGGVAGIVIKYGDEPIDGQATCPMMSAVTVVLPEVVGSPLTVPAHFAACGAPDVSVSAVLSLAKYQSLVG